ncbi:excalibur calcium-binding domain-containing protein [Myceligenerans pegani]|uniref:Excalibur calcium-binding domain-containing protein n=1 Tax=Myceligenerans pegani TaxID=2776917 RepID=A0ABR9N071_9MICO|nr:excalibur calcium-binding domain-containing protein [Myceligenerans sp. TRM 65318]MBE1877048.1 excalibur calcium-binding domain-containing protein [Myceligenerans sp. TRM 65318]MBE3019319.1 excalibur calcium-binding domain-containing protein [Myceligenerans sp. TRM 65318]
MAVRFNPPPGWQVPPGFRPDASWVPDPSWPPAPPGWEYWITEPNPAPPAAPQPPAPTPAPEPSTQPAPSHPAPTSRPTPTRPTPTHSAPTPNPAAREHDATATPAGGAPQGAPVDELTVRRAPDDAEITRALDQPTAVLSSGTPEANRPGTDETMIRPAPGPDGPAPREDTSTMALEAVPGAGAPLPHPPGQGSPGQAPPLPPGMPAGPGGPGFGGYGGPAGPGVPGPGGPGGPGMLPPGGQAPKSSVAAMGQNLLGSIKNFGNRSRQHDPTAAPPLPAGPGAPVPAGPGMHGPGGRPPAGRPGAPGGSRSPGSPLLIGVGIAGAALGVIIGVVVTAGLQADANQAITNAERIKAEVAVEREELEADRAELKKERDEVAQREQELSKRESELTKNERDLREQQEQQQREQQQREEQDDREENNGNGNGNGGFQFFFTCDDVRAAGRAPLPDSDPSYRWDLDRNGNGLACEDGE